ncbi:MAG TPA: hypothetical protein VMX33_11565 [bacterium]|nr:hypothetical protein [bacterium]
MLIDAMPDYAYILAPLVAYLLSRAIALYLQRRVRASSPASLVLLGSVSSMLITRLGATVLGAPMAMPSWTQAGLYTLLVDALCAGALFAAGVGAGLIQHPRLPAQQGHRRMRTVIAFCVPPIAGAALALGFGAVNGSSAMPIFRVALVLAAALWLFNDGTGTGLLAAGLAFALSSGPGPATTAALSVAASIAAIMAVLTGLATHSSRISAKPLAPALSLLLVWSLHEAGAAWPAAGLAGGFALGLITRIESEAPSATGVSKSTETFYERASAESSYALAFVAGFGISLDHLGSSAVAISIIAGSFLLASLLRTVIAESRHPYLPVHAIGFAALIAAERAGLASNAALAGAALAYLVAVSLSRPTRDGASDGSDAPAMKALVAVSLRGGSAGALAFAAAMGKPNEPIRAACVATADGAAGPGTAVAEEALVRSVAAGASAGIRVLPTVVVSASVPDGLARAALERRADAIILGLGDEDRSQKADPRSAIDGLLIAFPGSIIAVRKPESFAAAKRLVAIAIAGAEGSPGFVQALDAAARAWGRPARSIDALMIGAAASTFANASAGRIDGRTALSVQSWRDVPAALGSMPPQRTAFVIISPRPGSAGWNPGYERLPVVLRSAFPDSSIAFWLLPHATADTAAESDDSATGNAASTMQVPANHDASDHKKAVRGEPERGWPPIVRAAYDAGRVIVGMREEALVDAIRRLTDAIYPDDRGASGRLATEFSTVARKEPIELSPGILLLHAHARGVAIPTLAIGARPDGWPIVALSSAVKITVMLVSPDEAGPETHLEALTQIALAFRNLGLADQLLQDAASTT